MKQAYFPWYRERGSIAGQFEFLHSFQTTTLVLEEQTDAQMLRGPVKVHRDDIFHIARLDLEIPDLGELQATYTFYRLTPFGRETAATFTFPLAKTSNLFRRVELEVDQVQDIPLPSPFRTDAHPDTPVDVPLQTMTFQSVYHQAGVDLAVKLWNLRDVHKFINNYQKQPKLKNTGNLVKKSGTFVQKGLKN
jgi:hypothetical protein